MKVLTKTRSSRLFLALMLTVVAWSCGQQGAAGSAAEPTVTTAQDSTLYAVGHGMVQQFRMQGMFDADEAAIIALGFRDGVMGENFDLSTQAQQMNELMVARREKVNEIKKAEAEVFLTAAAGEAGAVRTESGLIYLETVAGSGPMPVVGDSITVHYHGMLEDGTVFDSSVERGEPITFNLGQVIPGWQEGLQLMKEGTKAKLTIPANLAYGPGGQGAIPPNATLVFEVELIKVHK